MLKRRFDVQDVNMVVMRIVAVQIVFREYQLKSDLNCGISKKNGNIKIQIDKNVCGTFYSWQ